MNPFDKYQGVHLNGKWFSKAELIERKCLERETPNLNEAITFAARLFDTEAQIEVQTSGSTGAPKKIFFPKSAFEQSALATNDFFELKEGSETALPLPMKFIAGKMMVARAVVGHHHLTVLEPSGNPTEDLGKTDFIPVTPFQMTQILAGSETGKTGTILIGGGAIDTTLYQEILKSGVTAYSSFGMTETLSHFALAKIEAGKKLLYKPLPGVSIKIDTSNNLEINWPGITSGWLKTGDLVELNGRDFQWLGRSDYLINSGGINIIPEEIESKLEACIASDFFVFGVPHPSLGQSLVLFIEGTSTEINFSDVDWKSKYHHPKSIVFITDFSRTISGKVKRKETVEIWKNTER